MAERGNISPIPPAVASGAAHGDSKPDWFVRVLARENVSQKSIKPQQNEVPWVHVGIYGPSYGREKSTLVDSFGQRVQKYGQLVHEIKTSAQRKYRVYCLH